MTEVKGRHEDPGRVQLAHPFTRPQESGEHSVKGTRLIHWAGVDLHKGL